MNVYLHYVYDLWVRQWRKCHARRQVIVIRGACPWAGRRPDPWADDTIVGFQFEDDARRFLDELRERLRTFALGLHPEKTRLIAFGRFAQANQHRSGIGRAETFDFLGFTHICANSRNGRSCSGGRACANGCGPNLRRSRKNGVAAGIGSVRGARGDPRPYRDWEGGRNDLALQACRQQPDRFAIMGRLGVDPANTAALAIWRAQSGMLGLRFTLRPEHAWLTDGSAEWLWRGPSSTGCPSCCLVPACRQQPDRIASATRSCVW